MGSTLLSISEELNSYHLPVTRFARPLTRSNALSQDGRGDHHDHRDEGKDEDQGHAPADDVALFCVCARGSRRRVQPPCAVAEVAGTAFAG